MNLFPLEPFLRPLNENPWTYLVFGVIGFFFGFVLESSGFGNSKKLAAQFYFKELTVLKVMFGAIVTAMALIFLSSAIGILDFNLVYVPETHLWPGILGGLIMGVGFIIGGFCPGTSLVSAATLKIDGIFFALGVLFGIWSFGETVDWYWTWWNTSGYYGRLTLMDVFHLPTGVMVLLVVLMALFMFWGAEQLERIFGKRDLTKEPRQRIFGAAALIVIALAVIVLGEPTTAEKYARATLTRTVDGERVTLPAEEVLSRRLVQIHPAELLNTLADPRLSTIMLDVRSEADYNLFHIRGARWVPLERLPDLVPSLLTMDANRTIVVVMSNDEAAATDAWRLLVAEAVPNVYILEGGINNWIAVFGRGEADIVPTPVPGAVDRLDYSFPAALGDRYEAADPNPHEWEIEYTPRIELERRRGPSGGGCG